MPKLRTRGTRRASEACRREEGAPISVFARARALRSSTLVGDGGLAFFGAVAVANLANFLFHVVMSRMLGPATYGALGSILGVVTVVTLAVSACQAAVTQVVAERRHGTGTSVALPLRRSTGRSAAVGLGLGAVVAAAAPGLRGFLHLASVVPVVLLGGFVATTVSALVPQGVLMGRLRFHVVALALASGAALRLVSGSIFVAVGWGLDGAVAATVVNAVVTLAVLVWPLREDLALRAPSAPLRLGARSAVLAVVALGGVSAFVGLDSFLARHYLARTASGYYVAAATAGRIALFLPAAVGMAAFPRLAAHGGRGPEARALLRHAVAIVALLGGATAVVLAAVPHTVIDVLFGSRYASAATALRVLGLAAAAVGVITVCVYALLARRSLFSAVAWPAIGVLAAGVTLFHRGVTEIAWVVLAATGGLLVVAVAAVAFGDRGQRGPDDAERPQVAASSLHTGLPPRSSTRTGTDA